MKIPIIHIVCGGIAFFYFKEPNMSELVKSEYAEYPDGGKPDAHTKMVCGNCKKDIKLGELVKG